jgi:hypothetical protein
LSRRERLLLPVTRGLMKVGFFRLTGWASRVYRRRQAGLTASTQSTD